MPTLSLQKTVRNVTQNSAEADSVNANPDDTVEFALRVSSVGTDTVFAVIVRDVLPVGLTYQAGSTTIDAVPAADGVISSGLVLGDMYAGRTITVRFQAVVAGTSFFAPGTSVLTNVGYIRGTNATETSDAAFVTVVYTPSNLSLTLTKVGRNTTRGETAEHAPVNSAPSDTIEFVMRIRNTSAAVVSDVLVRDIVPQGITAVAGSVNLNGSPASDSLISSGLMVGSLAPGQEILVSFSGRVIAASQLPAGVTTVLNTAQVLVGGSVVVTAQMAIVITNTVVVPPISTGPGESTVLALIISAIVTLLYVGYTGTDFYRRREAGSLVKKAKKDRSLFDFRR